MSKKNRDLAAFMHKFLLLWVSEPTTAYTARSAYTAEGLYLAQHSYRCEASNTVRSAYTVRSTVFIIFFRQVFVFLSEVIIFAIVLIEETQPPPINFNSISMLSGQVKAYIPIIIDFLKGQPVLKAWLFGSCSRGEESSASDIDLLLDYDYDAGASLMTVSGIRLGLKKLLNREIDVVENGCLLPFAAASAQRDKILIYERKAQG